jgi:hypothetical protein
MILILRGHIRKSFESGELYDLMESFLAKFPELKIYIHTWNIFSNNISWRNIPVNSETVTEDIIYNYFGKLKGSIKHIIIDDDQKNELHGSITGTINNGPMPIIGWKNYWYGKYRIIDYIYKESATHDEMIINTRFDVLNNMYGINKEQILSFITKNSEVKWKRNIFLYDYEDNGIDNIYVGSINTMHTLITKFNFDLDDILRRNTDTIHQERFVYRTNAILFE